MTRDLVRDGAQVHDMAAAVLDFWFGLTQEQHFAKDDGLDRQIADRFGAMRDGVLRGDAEGRRDDPDALLAAIILLDQFSRNIHRDTAQGFAADDLAVELTLEAIAKGWEGRFPPERRVFLYMPLMHAELAERGMPQDLVYLSMIESGFTTSATSYVAATHANGSLLGPTYMSAPGFPFTPAKPGETIVLYGSGFGITLGSLTEGAATQSGALPNLPAVTIGGLDHIGRERTVMEPEEIAKRMNEFRNAAKAA